MTVQLGLRGIRTRRRRPVGSAEFELQCALITWAKLNERRYPELVLLHHIPNGGHRYRNVAVDLKRAGVKPGVPDLVLPVSRRRGVEGHADSGHWNGLYLELKAPKGALSQAQRWWLERLSEQGYCVAVARTLEDAIAVLESYLNLAKLRAAPWPTSP